MKREAAARGVSLVLTTAVVIAAVLNAYLLSSDPAWTLLGSLFFGTILWLFIAVSPMGSIASVFTMWSGYWVNSCPYCMAVSVDRMETTHAECDSCGEHILEVDPVVRDIRVTRHSKDEPVRHYCSTECSRGDE